MIYFLMGVCAGLVYLHLRMESKTHNLLIDIAKAIESVGDRVDDFSTESWEKDYMIKCQICGAYCLDKHHYKQHLMFHDYEHTRSIPDGEAVIEEA